MSNGWTLAVLLCSGWTGLNLLLIAFLYRLDGDDHDEDDDNDDDVESEMCASQATKHLVLFPLPPSRLQMSPGFNRFHPNSSNSCYKCHQVSKLFTQSHLPAGSPCPRKTWHSNDAEFILKAFFTFVIFSRQIYAESMADRGGRGWLENRGLPIFSRVSNLHNFHNKLSSFLW